jgi:hypothetical protein
MDSHATLPVRRLTLYKHGVGFVEREGRFAGERLELVFRSQEVNDALKSLLVLVRGGGQVRGIAYDTPVDQAARLAESPIHLSDDHALLDLLRGLRGTTVRLDTGTGTQTLTIEGRLLGVEAPEDAPARNALVTLWDETSNSVVVQRLRDVRQVALREERPARDVRYVLDTSRSEDTRRTVTVRLSPGEHDLTVSYLVPSPTWRVTYRLVAEQDRDGAANPRAADGGAPAPRTGRLLLQGWGLFDNRLEEDLEDVRVTLVAGQPISFVYDLATSHIPQRRVVEDQARVAAGPVEFERAVEKAAVRSSLRSAPSPAPAGAAGGYRLAAAAAEPAQMYMARANIADMAEQPIAAAGSDLGELFQYRVSAPVSVGRGGSALVPILAAQVPYRRELLFNQQKLPDHPVAALRFTNDTGLVLERGPVTVLEDGEYRGEAIVPFTKTGTAVYLAFAVELAISAKTSSAWRTEIAGLRIDKALLWTKQARVFETTYTLTSDADGPEVVTIEHPLRSGFDLVNTRPPDEQTPECYRWLVPCPPRQSSVFVVSQRTFEWQQQQLLDQSYEALREFLARRWLDDTTLARIRSILQTNAAIARNEQEAAELEQERERIYTREEQLRKNLAALVTTGDEAALRQRIFAQLQASESRLGAIDERIAALQEENKRHKASLAAALETLTVDEAPAVSA